MPITGSKRVEITIDAQSDSTFSFRSQSVFCATTKPRSSRLADQNWPREGEGRIFQTNGPFATLPRINHKRGGREPDWNE